MRSFLASASRKPKLLGLAVLIAAGASQAVSAASVLVDAARSLDTAGAVAAIAQQADVNEAEADGTTALHWAVHHDDAKLVEALLQAGADPTVANDYGATPMSEAAVVGNVEVIEQLLDAGADADSPNAEGQTALMVVARTSNIEAAR